MIPFFVFKDSWPYSSPGLSGCDNWRQGVTEADPGAVTHNSIDDLRTS